MQKQWNQDFPILASRTHFVESDLLRTGEPMRVLGNDVEAHYRILVSRDARCPYDDSVLAKIRARSTCLDMSKANFTKSNCWLLHH